MTHDWDDVTGGAEELMGGMEGRDGTRPSIRFDILSGTTLSDVGLIVPEL